MESSAIGRVIGWTAIAATLVITPWFSADPINVPKYAVLVLIAGIALAVIIRNYKEVRKRENRLVVLVGGVFLLMLFSAFIASKINPWAQLFGVTGRNTGLITYFSLLTLFLAAAVLTTKGFESTYSKTLLVGGVASTLYGLLQSFELDPADWVNSYSPVIGFLGNPNFQSSFIGMSCVVAVSLMLQVGSSKLNQLGLLVYTLVGLFVVSRSDAQQGYLVFLAGLVSVFGIFVWQSNLKKLFIPYFVLSVIGFIVVALGTLNKGLLASVLYKDSVTYRGDYWRAGWKVTLENPIFGVGLDGYGDWYRRARTVEATLRRGPDVTSNAAHNVLLDLSSNGGFPLLIAYLALLALVVAAIVKTLKSGQKFDPHFAALVGAWIGYNAQSIISLNQIGLAIWGWILGGAIIGYSRYGAEKISKSPVRNSRNVSAASIARTRISPASAVAVFLGLALGAGAGMPPYLASQEFRQALESGDAIKVQSAAYIWPVDPSRMVQVALILKESKLEAQGLEVAFDATKNFPDNYLVWATLDAMKSPTGGQKTEALTQMQRLDPMNPNLK